MKSRFEVENPDFVISPLTGMTRHHYIEPAKYLLKRAFTHVKSASDPVNFPIVPGRRLALTAYSGWDSLHSAVHKDRNAEADESTVRRIYYEEIDGKRKC